MTQRISTPRLVDLTRQGLKGVYDGKLREGEFLDVCTDLLNARKELEEARVAVLWLFAHRKVGLPDTFPGYIEKALAAAAHDH